jgi:hypothetical protein
MHGAFNAHLAEPRARLELTRADEMAKAKKVTLLCLGAGSRRL